MRIVCFTRRSLRHRLQARAASVAALCALSLGTSPAIAGAFDTGQLLRDFNRNANEYTADFTVGTDAVSEATSDVQRSDVQLHPNVDPCPEVPHPAADASAEKWRSALNQLASCMNSGMASTDLVRSALIHTLVFSRSLLEKPLSQMTDERLADFLRTDFVIPDQLVGRLDHLAPSRRKLRNLYEDRELDEYARLTRRLVARLTAVEDLVYAAVGAHRDVIEYFAPASNRYGLMLLLHELKTNHATGDESLRRVAQFIESQGMKVPEDLTIYPPSMLHPRIVLAVMPDANRELKALQEPAENPFDIMFNAMAQLAGPDAIVAKQVARYTSLRLVDNPKLPPRQAPDPKAARVAVLDTGVDFIKYPDLAEFLSDSSIPGTMGSYDYQDNDRNPWLPALDPESSHGTGVIASILTVISHYAPSVLPARKVDIAVWKTGTIRSQLSYPYLGRTAWESRVAIPEALIHQATDPSVVIKPQIVSISAIFGFNAYLLNSGHPDAVLNAPWLWVMAAGNEGAEIAKQSIPPCLGDVPIHLRREENILCVGALKRGIVHDSIPAYSNFGARVDLYTYESHSELCASGTSCSTPAITGVAAAVQAKYPEFTPDVIKRVLVEASQFRTLRVGAQLTPSGQPANVRKVRVLDPSTMMHRVMRRAAHHAKRLGQSL